jgi:hypothetical protein
VRILQGLRNKRVSSSGVSFMAREKFSLADAAFVVQLVKRKLPIQVYQETSKVSREKKKKEREYLSQMESIETLNTKSGGPVCLKTGF